MKKFVIGLLASAALAAPAFAQTQSPQTQNTPPDQSAPNQTMPGQGRDQMGGQMEPSQLSSQQIRDIQQALKDKGHDVTVDGVWGPSTASALREFQEKQGIQGSGELNTQTMTALGVNTGAQPDSRISPGAPPSGQTPGQSNQAPGSPDADKEVPGAAPQQKLPGTDKGPSSPSR